MVVNLENSFWEENNGINIHSVFNTFWEKDVSENKKESSKIMWAIYLLVNPDSILYNDPAKDVSIVKNFIKDLNFKWDDYEDLVYAYKDIVLTTAEKALQNWNELMTMRDKSLKKMYISCMDAGENGEVNATELKNLDSILANTPKMFADYSKIKKEYEEEKTQKKGKSIKSLSDSDDI